MVLKKTEKKFDEYKQSYPVQLTLFSLLDGGDENYSQTIEFYDFIPKYVVGNVEKHRIEGKFLEPVKRQFECRGKSYGLTLLPARVEISDGEFKDYFMGVREEIVEDALRKLAVEGKGVMLDDELGLAFTIYEIEKELAETGHTYSYSQIVNALKILATATIHISAESEQSLPETGKSTKNGKKKDLFFHPIETLAFESADETPTFVRFSPLVTKSIREHSFRMINYKQSMRLKSYVSRSLFKRLSHHFTQAEITKPYGILLSTIIRDFGLTMQSRLKNNLENVEDALKELRETDSILAYKIEKIYDVKKKNKLIDAKITITPSFSFSGDAKRFNAKTKKNKEMLGGSATG